MKCFRYIFIFIYYHVIILLLSFFSRDLKTNKGPHLAGLHNEELFEKCRAMVPEDTLKKISVEQDFDVTFVDVDEKSKDNKYHYFVQLSTNPVAVCF